VRHHPIADYNPPSRPSEHDLAMHCKWFVAPQNRALIYRDSSPTVCVESDVFIARVVGMDDAPLTPADIPTFLIDLGVLMRKVCGVA